MKQAKKAAQDKETEYRTSASTLYPQPDYASEYVVNFSVKRDDNIDQNHYIYEACYILAASSVGFQQDDAYEHTVRDILDYTFDITGLDDKGEEQQICWLPSVNPSYETKEEEYIKDWIPNPDDPEGDPIPKYGTRYIVNITANYSVTLSSTFRDMVNDKCGLEDLPDDAPSYDMSTKDLANLSAVELMKFYSVGGNADLGDVGLPLPSRSYYISSPFGDRELNGAQQNHKGVDLAAAYGTQVYAVKDGTAQVPGYSNSYGNYVTITHEGGTKTRYAHMSSVVVSDGQEVTAGQVIGYVGSTGDSTGNHLHFEVINPSGQRIDPMQTEVGVLIDANKTH